ncbi:MAG: thiamine pyrophosphate-dependent dehydrogenase E1 component subunit alpha [Clostridiales bacterium]|nr:thiamine pyrophosphate-dependent dehydrogenase E1 component subunit alpha [Clostridiales bacterium]
MIQKERLTLIYRTMNIIRKFEEKALYLFENNYLRGSMHLCIGQEAIPATVCSLLRDEDYITSTHRGHGHCIAKGAEPGKAMAELMGKATGYCKGKGGSMHIADLTKGNLGANAIVGAGIPIAAGAALAAQLRGSDQVTVAFFGDGASNQGVFHEGINLAAVWKLPVIFICENNGFGISVPVSESTSVKDISQRAAAYDIPGVTIDGNDVFAINEAVEKAIERARSGEGPTLIECKTYRWFGHWTGDPQVYRTREEVEAWKGKCPIKRLRKYLLQNGILTEKELDKIEQDAYEEIEEAAQFAIESPEPDPAAVMEDVFYEEVEV